MLILIITIDFAYGFVKCVALTSNTQRNPDTYALFATGVFSLLSLP